VKNTGCAKNQNASEATNGVRGLVARLLKLVTHVGERTSSGITGLMYAGRFGRTRDTHEIKVAKR